MTYERTEVIEVPKDWGKEIWMANTEFYCGKMLYVNKGWRCSLHYHKDKDETFHFYKGKILLELDDEELVVQEGDPPVRLKPGTRHRFSGLEDSIIIEISTHHEDSDSYRIEIGGEVPKEIMEEYS